MFIDLTKALIDFVNQSHHQRKAGRYSISELWGMMNGYMTPDEFFNRKPMSFQDAFRVWQGQHKHSQVEPLLKSLGYLVEQKAEVDFIDFKIVGRCDAINDFEVIEVKSSENILESSKRWHNYQARMYCSVFGKPVCRIVQPIHTKDKLYLKVIGEIKRNENWYKKEVEKIKTYHLKLKEYESSKAK